jgi:protein TonB
MFSNLIESSSHKRELRRRGSFFLFTVVSYSLVFAIAGVASIYAYDARMEDQSFEVVMMTPVEFPVAQPADHEPLQPRTTNTAGNRETFVSEREFPMATVNRPELQPEGISLVPNKNLPLPPGLVRITGRDRDAGSGSPGPGPIGPGSTNLTPSIAVEIEIPPPAPAQKPKPIVISKGPLNGSALELPKPIYPAMAKEIRLQGRVTVQVLIDETGKVISAQVIDGNPVFTPVARNAALHARFSPTLLGDQPVKVSGVITYNFVLQ